MKYKTYKEASHAVEKAYTEEQYQDAIRILEEIREENLFSQHEYEISWDSACLYMLTKQHENALAILEKGISKGLFFPLFPESELWKPIKELQRFKILIEKNSSLLTEAQEQALSKYEVIVPKNFSQDNTYPLFIAIHGWGEDIEFFRRYWQSDKLRREYITVFVQSSQVVSAKGFAWNDASKGKDEILAIYQQVIENYPVDTERIIIGGFSQGGSMSIDLTLDSTIYASGFIALCPGKPDAFGKEQVAKKMYDGAKGVILTGDKDGSLSTQREMEEVFIAVGFPYEFDITEGLGHWFPDNLADKIDKAIAFIMEE